MGKLLNTDSSLQSCLHSQVSGSKIGAGSEISLLAKHHIHSGLSLIKYPSHSKAIGVLESSSFTACIISGGIESSPQQS